MDRILIDSGALIALSDVPDRHHQRAAETYNRLTAGRARLVTTNHIVDETCTWLLQHTREGHRAAVRFGKTIREKAVAVTLEQEMILPAVAHRLLVVYSDSAAERRAWQIFEKYDTAGFTLTDCVSFAVMEALSIRQAFTFDEHYDVMGFERLPR